MVSYFLTLRFPLAKNLNFQNCVLLFGILNLIIFHLFRSFLNAGPLSTVVHASVAAQALFSALFSALASLENALGVDRLLLMSPTAPTTT